MMKLATLLLLGLLLITPPVMASNEVAAGGRLAHGIAQTGTAVFAIPEQMISHTRRHGPVGLVSGTVDGAFRTVGRLLKGVGNIVGGALPFAKYGALFV